jgi:acyl-CoA synthetase (AMP-forming)/AMP-acid ligase II
VGATPAAYRRVNPTFVLLPLRPSAGRLSDLKGAALTTQIVDGNGRTATLVDQFRAVFLGRPEMHIHRFLPDGEGRVQSISNEEVDRRARAVARVLQERLAVGDRALILCPSGHDYMASFYGCLYAGVAAVPMYPPNPMLLKRTLPRLVSVIEDAQPTVILATAEVASMADQINEQAPALRSLQWITVDAIDGSAAQEWRRPPIIGSDTAFLQYTSGSTGRPKGVVVTHANLLHNCGRMSDMWLCGDTDASVVTWLPPYHDMGLIGTMLLPAYAGCPVTTMTPMAFLKRPFRWLKALSEHQATVTGAPNFAYELCLSKISEAERATLDLSRLRVAFSGAEPVRAGTLERFAEAFAPQGFRSGVFWPGYGLAEATLVVSGGDRSAERNREPVTLRVDTEAFSEGRVVESQETSTSKTVVSCGQSVADQHIVIADPADCSRLPEDRIGEIWVSGPSVAAGYWKRVEESERTFAARLAGTGEGPYLRTGDLGFMHGGELYIAGRLKDVIIIAGENRHPQDIEQSVERVDPILRPSNAVFSADIDGEEKLVVVHEVTGLPSESDAERAFSAIRAVVARDHGLQVHEIVFVRPGNVPKTSSGKVQRSACKLNYLNGSLQSVARSVSS